MKQLFQRLFNWNKYPKAVFLFALPLFCLGWMLCLSVMVLQIKLHHDFSYLIAFVLISSLGIAAYVRMCKAFGRKPLP